MRLLFIWVEGNLGLVTSKENSESKRMGEKNMSDQRSRKGISSFEELLLGMELVHI